MRNGSGSYSLPSGNPVNIGTTIDPTWANTTLTDIATTLTQSISQDGQTPITNNLPMTGFRHTNVANAQNRNEYASAAQCQDNAFDWLTAVAGTDTITATAAIGMTAYVTGQCFRFFTVGPNSVAVTLNINGLGAKAITKNGSIPLVSGDIPSRAIVEVVYDGTQFQLVSSSVYHAYTAESALFATSSSYATNSNNTVNATNVTGTIANGVTATTQAIGDNSTNVATTAFVRNAFVSSLLANGYQKLPSGLIIQWGASSAIAAGSNLAITFPIAFPAKAASVQLTSSTLDTGVGTTNSSVTGTGLTGFTINNRQNNSATFFWFAIGY
jgi:hypothetical protein